jgi:quercetin dioxygenase-like cupin family protein
MALAQRGSCIAHGIMASHKPDRTLVEPVTSKRSMPVDAVGLIGPEHVTRFQSARRYEAGPNTEFIDFFNANLIPGIKMSGGYGLFHHGGRLPAHIHDFDESITIIEGEAICNVEGRRYTMSNRAAALPPRGRIHYFINETHSPMAMLWVYAGPLPERIEIDESLTRPGAQPWSEA